MCACRADLLLPTGQPKRGDKANNLLGAASDSTTMASQDKLPRQLSVEVRACHIHCLSCNVHVACTYLAQPAALDFRKRTDRTGHCMIMPTTIFVCETLSVSRLRILPESEELLASSSAQAPCSLRMHGALLCRRSCSHCSVHSIGVHLARPLITHWHVQVAVRAGGNHLAEGSADDSMTRARDDHTRAPAPRRAREEGWALTPCLCSDIESPSRSVSDSDLLFICDPSP